MIKDCWNHTKKLTPATLAVNLLGKTGLQKVIEFYTKEPLVPRFPMAIEKQLNFGGEDGVVQNDDDTSQVLSCSTKNVERNVEEKIVQLSFKNFFGAKSVLTRFSYPKDVLDASSISPFTLLTFFSTFAASETG